MERARHYRDTTALVTGGAGAIGANLVRALCDAGAREIVVLDDLSSGHRWLLPDDPRVRLIEGSVVDPSALADAFAGRPRRVFHLAAHFANQNSVEHPERDLEVNGLGTLRALTAAVEHGAGRFVYASSGCAVHGPDLPLPAVEHRLSAELSTPYQIHKLLGELYAGYTAHRHGLQVARPRLFNVYGPGEVPGRYRNVIPNFVYRALRGWPLRITGTGDETRDFCWIGDAVDGLLRAGALDAAVGEPFNLASGVETRIGTVAERIVALADSSSSIEHTARRGWDTRDRLCASVERAQQRLGYRPGAVGLEEGIRRTIAWCRAHWDQIVEETDLER